MRDISSFFKKYVMRPLVVTAVAWTGRNSEEIMDFLFSNHLVDADKFSSVDFSYGFLNGDLQTLVLSITNGSDDSDDEEGYHLEKGDYLVYNPEAKKTQRMVAVSKRKFEKDFKVYNT